MEALPTLYRVLTLAFPSPPPDSPTGAGMAVTKLEVNAAKAREITSHGRETSGTSATASARAQRPVMIQFTARRAASEFMRPPASGHAATCARAAGRRC